MQSDFTRKMLLLVSVFALFYASSCKPIGHSRTHPVVSDGFLDLRGWNFTDPEIISLNGEWRFVWKRLLEPDELQLSDSVLAPVTIQVPGNWNDVRSDGRRFERHGYGTYWLRIMLPEEHPTILGLKFINIRTAYRVYVNGQWLRTVGRVATDAASAQATIRPNILTIDADMDTLTLMIQVSNHHFRSGGIAEKIVIGELSRVYRKHELYTGYTFFIAGGLFIIGFYHLILYQFNRRERPALLFGLFALVFAIRLLIIHEYWLWNLCPQVSYRWQLIAEYITLYLAYPLFVIYLASIFPAEFDKRLVRLMQLVTGILILMVIILPLRIIYHFVPYFLLFVIGTAIPCYLFIIQATVHRREGARLFVSAATILFIILLHDIWVYSRQAPENYLLFPAIFVFVFFLAVFHSRRLIRTFLRVEELSQELNDVNKSLEEKIARKTESLQEANAKLSYAYSRLKLKTDELEGAIEEPENSMLLSSDGIILGVSDKLIEETTCRRDQLIRRRLDEVLEDRSGIPLMKTVTQALYTTKAMTLVNPIECRDPHKAFKALFTRLNLAEGKYLLLRLIEIEND